ncbi:hypothetical protein DFH09DRAFT_1101571 [Mycena vulgaris]|nr:hypothetical protein DFH09DRAFT_1101571 [Mycena vulgaris]
MWELHPNLPPIGPIMYWKQLGPTGLGKGLTEVNSFHVPFCSNMRGIVTASHNTCGYLGIRQHKSMYVDGIPATFIKSTNGNDLRSVDRAMLDFPKILTSETPNALAMSSKSGRMDIPVLTKQLLAWSLADSGEQFAFAVTFTSKGPGFLGAADETSIYRNPVLLFGCVVATPRDRDGLFCFELEYPDWSTYGWDVDEFFEPWFSQVATGNPLSSRLLLSMDVPFEMERGLDDCPFRVGETVMVDCSTSAPEVNCKFLRFTSPVAAAATDDACAFLEHLTQRYTIQHTYNMQVIHKNDALFDKLGDRRCYRGIFFGTLCSEPMSVYVATETGIDAASSADDLDTQYWVEPGRSVRASIIAPTAVMHRWRSSDIFCGCGTVSKPGCEKYPDAKEN